MILLIGLFLFFLVVGVLCNLFLFQQETKHTQNKRFLTSERLIVFVIEILIAIIGFGVTLAFTNAYEDQVEKEKAICILEQTIEYTDRQVEREKNYLVMYNKGNIAAASLRNSNVISLAYYDNILSNEVILQNANMKTYGEIMTLFAWIENRNAYAEAAENDAQIYSALYKRYTYLKDIREYLQICHDELAGDISEEEAEKKCHDIKYGEDDKKEKKTSKDSKS